MKSLIHYFLGGLLYVAAACSFAACDDEETYPDNPYLHLENEQTTFEAGASKTEYTVTVRSNCPWQVVCRTEGTDWVRAFPDEGDEDGHFNLIVSANSGFQARQAEFALVVGEQEYPILLCVNQAASVPTITVGDGSGTVRVPSAGGPVTVTSQANVEWTCSVDAAAQDWLRFDSISAQGLICLTLAQNNGLERTGILHCTSDAEPSANVDISIVQASGSILLQEDFSWLNYGTAITYDTDGQVRIDSWTADELAHGWTSTPNSASKDEPLVYGCLGFVKLGKTNYAGDLVSPKLKVDGTVNVKVTFKACGYVSKGGTRDDNELYVSVIGPGTVKADNPFIIDNYPNSSKNEYGEGYDVWSPDIAERSFTIEGVTDETQIRFMAGVSFDLHGVGQGKNRIFLDDITVAILE